VLIAVDNNDRRMLAIHSLALAEGRRLIVSSVVVAQAWRDGRRHVVLGRFLDTCEVVQLGVETAKAAGVLCGRAGTSDIVDATVVVVAVSTGAIVWTSDPTDIRTLAAGSGARSPLVLRTV
jgi:predicted nucleic acid-binding protein